MESSANLPLQWIDAAGGAACSPAFVASGAVSPKLKILMTFMMATSQPGEMAADPLSCGGTAVAMPEVVTRSLSRVQQVGVQLDAMAMQALSSLPADHAVEMLEYIADNHSYLRNPSKYISSTVARGFVPRRSGSMPMTVPPPTAATGGNSNVPESNGTPPVPATVSAEGLQALLLQAQQAGLTLSADATQALAGLPQEHASELLDFVLEKHGELRDPSNYIASTVARGFKSRRGGSQPHYVPAPLPSSAAEAVAKSLQKLRDESIEVDDMAQQALASLPPEHALEMLEYIEENHSYLRNPSNYISSTVARGFVPRRSNNAAAAHTGKGGCAQANYGFAAGGSPVNASLVPTDATPLERRILQINSHSLPAGQQIDFMTYMALRCIPSWQASELLDSLAAKSGFISSACNYIQAAVTKINRGQGWSTGAGGPHVAGGASRSPAPQVQAATEWAASEQWSSQKRQRMW